MGEKPVHSTIVTASSSSPSGPASPAPTMVMAFTGQPPHTPCLCPKDVLLSRGHFLLLGSVSCYGKIAHSVICRADM